MFVLIINVKEHCAVIFNRIAGWLLLGWFPAADCHRCRQCSRHQLVLRLRHCGCFYKVKG